MALVEKRLTAKAKARKKKKYFTNNQTGKKELAPPPGYVPEKKKPVVKKKKAKGYPKSVYESKEWDEKGWKKSKKPVVKKKPVAKKKKEQKIPPGGISLGSSSTTTWKQTPTSKAVDDREYKKKSKRWLRSKNKSWADQPVRPPSVGAVAQVKRKTDAKGSRSSFSGPGGMKPKWMDLYGNWMKKKEKLKKKK